MKLLITGSNGQLGWELCQRKEQHGFDSISCDLPHFDLTDKKNIATAMAESSADVVINTAAYTAVDQAEKEPEKAFAVNRDGAANLAAACKKQGIPLVHISTDYVFNGQKEGPYRESDPISPIGVYGQSKAQGEDRIREILNAHVIIRTSWLYSVHANNFVKTMLRLGKEREEIRVVDDQFGCPTYAGDLADAILKIAKRLADRDNPAYGTYHYSNAGKTTWFQFAQRIFEFASAHERLALKKLVPITTAEYPTLAQRPVNSELNCRLIAESFGLHLIPWPDSLSKMIGLLYA